MGDISSFHMEKSQTSNNFNLEHNERFKKPSYLLEQGHFQVNKSYAEALALKNQIISSAIKKYTERTGQKFQSKSYEWSAVVNLKPSSTMQDLEKLAEHLQEKYGFQCYQIAIHKDEGHIDENGEKVLNLHAHLEFITLDRETGKNNFRGANTTKKALSRMQDEVAEILQMQRGIRTLDLRADERRALRRIKPRIWAKMKESEKGERKAMLENVNFKHKQELDEVKFQANKEILDYKSQKDDEILGLKTDLQNEKTAHKATKKQLDELIEKTRKEMIAEGDNTKKQYDELRTLKKELCDDENATLEQALKAIKELREAQAIIKKQEKYIKELETKIEELNEKLAQNAKDTPKIENQPLIVKIDNQQYKIDLPPLEMQNLATKYTNTQIINITNALIAFKNDALQPQSKEKYTNTYNKAIKSLFDNSPQLSNAILQILEQNHKELFKQISKIQNQNQGISR